MANWSLQVGSMHYQFSSTATAPWRDIYHAGVNLSFIHPFDREWSLMVSPAISAAGEADADAGKALSYGFVSALNWQAKDSLRLGVGGIVFENLEERQVFPLLMIDWQLADKWKLSNSLRSGVAGPAGLELSWVLQPVWTLGVGGAWRSLRFRLDDSAPERDGIGEEQQIPIWVRATREVPLGSLSLYVGMALNGELSLESRRGDVVYRQDYDDAPFGALYFSGAF